MSNPPTVDQLHNLTDRAAHGLTADEQQRLRDGLVRLEHAEKALARIQAIADEHPAGIDTALIHAELPDQPGPATAQATANPWEQGGNLAQAGIDTPGCDCGHDGMGVSWHRDDCLWRRGVVDCPGRPTPG